MKTQSKHEAKIRVADMILEDGEKQLQKKHTPKPWIYDGNLIETKEYGDLAVTSGPDREANADYIVKAVNSHEALVNALASWVESEEDEHRATQGHDVAGCNYCMAVEALKQAGEL